MMVKRRPKSKANGGEHGWWESDAVMPDRPSPLKVAKR